MQPSETVVHAFDASGEPERLPGGRGTSWRAGDVVLKPIDLPPEELAWLDVLASSQCFSGQVRLALPLRSRNGLLVEDGWTATPFLPGHVSTSDWPLVADVARRFSATFADEPRPAFLDRRQDPWADADRFAWCARWLIGRSR